MDSLSDLLRYGRFSRATNVRAADRLEADKEKISRLHAGLDKLAMKARIGDVKWFEQNAEGMASMIILGLDEGAN